MNKDQKNLIRLGIRYLRHIHKKQLAFNLNSWGSKQSHCVYDEEYCGTTACAMGHFALLPEFQALGLHMRTATTGRGTIIPTFEAMQKSRNGSFTCRLDQHGSDADGIDAAMELFGMSDDEARKCFMPRYSGGGSDVTAADVANVMQEVLDNHKNDRS